MRWLALDDWHAQPDLASKSIEEKPQIEHHPAVQTRRKDNFRAPSCPDQGGANTETPQVFLTSAVSVMLYAGAPSCWCLRFSTSPAATRGARSSLASPHSLLPLVPEALAEFCSDVRPTMRLSTKTSGRKAPDVMGRVADSL